MTNLRRELHQLRRWTDGDSLEVTGSQLCWHERGRHAVDLATFLAERQAVLASDDPEVVVEHGVRGLTEYGGDLLPTDSVVPESGCIIAPPVRDTWAAHFGPRSAENLPSSSL